MGEGGFLFSFALFSSIFLCVGVLTTQLSHNLLTVHAFQLFDRELINIFEVSGTTL